MNAVAHQKKKNEKIDKRENRRPISKKLCAVLRRSFKVNSGKKMVRVRGVPRVTGTLGKANSHFDLTQTGLGTAPPR